MTEISQTDEFLTTSLVPRSKVTVRQTGAVYTPAKIASSLVNFSLKKIDNPKPRVLEPSVGDGAFLNALFYSKAKSKITAIDIDRKTVLSLANKFNSHLHKSVELHTADFLQYSKTHVEKKFDLVIGNPPFIRKHNFSESFKIELVELADRTGYEHKDLKNAWSAFVVAANEHLSEKGVLAFIVPYELLNVNYGICLQKNLFIDFDRVDIFIPDEKPFKDIDQDAVIFVAQKQSSEKHGIYMHRVDNLINLRLTNLKNTPTDSSADWSLSQKTFLLPQDAIDLIEKLRSECSTVGDYCSTRPGIVTAANDYFILSQTDVMKFKLWDYVKPILKKASYLTRYPVFTTSNFDSLLQDDVPAFFLHIKGEDKDTFSDELKAYLKLGQQMNIHARYKCKNRNHWFEVPFVPAHEAYFFKRSHSFPRLCLNEANVLVTDTAYCISSKDEYQAKDICLSFFNSMSLLFSEIDGRFYGGGVLELTPKEFRGLPLAYRKSKASEFKTFNSQHNAGKNILNILNFGDTILSDSLSLSEVQTKTLRDAWLTLRSHRLRHSGQNPEFSN